MALVAVFLLPITADPRQTFTIALAGEDFRLDLDWVGRQSSWSLSVRSSDGDLALGLRLVPGVELLARRDHRDDAPAGTLVLLGDLAGAPAGLDDLASGAALLLFATGEDAQAITDAGLPR